MSEELRHFTRYGEYKAGVHHKFYEVTAVEREDGTATWEFKWGRIGGRGQSKTGTSFSFGNAREVCIAKFAEKEEKGYREVNPLMALASAAQDAMEREDSNGLPAVAITIPSFRAGKSEDRCLKCARKYVDKLNVIRASRFDLGSDAYRKQIETMLRQYCEEWRRIRCSKTHGPNIKGPAVDSFRSVYRSLVENADTYFYIWHDEVHIL